MAVQRVNARAELRGGGKRVMPRSKPPTKRIDQKLMWALLDAGKSAKEGADELGGNKSTVSGHIKRRRRKTTELVVASEATPVIERKLNAMDQLHRINEDANRLLNTAMGGVRQLEGVDLDSLDVQETIDAMRAIAQGRDVALRAMAEIRGQLKLQLELFQAMYDVRAAEEFQQEVLAAIREVDEDVRNRILDRLRQRRAVRQLVQPS